MNDQPPPSFVDPAVQRRVSQQTWGIAAVAVLPGLVTWMLSPVLDGYPYLASALFGVGAMVGVWRLVEKFPKLREKGRFLDPWLIASGSGWVLFLFGPSWGMAFCILANRALDRSPPVDRPSTILSLKRSHTGPDSFYVASWRKSAAQLRVPLRIGTPLRALREQGKGPGDNVILTTRKGAFGFEYIVDAKTPAPANTSPAEGK